MIHLDTQVLIWLYAGDFHRLSAKAKSRIDQERSFISPTVVLELHLLGERGRLAALADIIIDDLKTGIDLDIRDTRFGAVIDAARGLTWIRDPFDRLIVANAKADGAELITADRSILANFSRATW